MAFCEIKKFKLSVRMSSKKGLELLKAIGQYMTEAEGFDRVLKSVSKIHFENIFSNFTFDLRGIFQFSLHSGGLALVSQAL